MAAATAEKKPSTSSTEELLLTLADVDMLPVKGIAGKFPDSALAAAWVKGLITFGHTKYSISGNPESWESRPTLIIEGGIEWMDPRQAVNCRMAGILKGVEMPQARFYQKYQQEVQVSREKDSWEWVESPEDIKDRPTRWARRTTDRAECEKLYCLYIRLTDKGLAALQGD